MPYVENQAHSDVTYGFLPYVDAIRMHVAEALVEIKKRKRQYNCGIITYNTRSC